MVVGGREGGGGLTGAPPAGGAVTQWEVRGCCITLLGGRRGGGSGDVLQPYNVFEPRGQSRPESGPASKHRSSVCDWSSGAAAAQAVTSVQLDLESIIGDGGFRPKAS